jgi:U3 small nucleolar RNA-associated protein 18
MANLLQQSSVDCLTFHPHHPILLSSGPSSTASLHHISPSTLTPNPILTTLHIRHTPFHTAVVHPSGAQIFLSGRRRYLHVWNLASGTVTKLRCPPTHAQDQKTMECFKISPSGTHIGLVGSSRKGGGVINILDASTLQWTAQVRVDSRGGIADFAWWSSSTGLTVAGKSGEVSEYDLETRRIVSRWTDDGAVGTTVLAMGGKSGRTHLGGDRWIAIGSSSGIANIYDRRSWATDSNSDSNSTADSNAGVPPRPKPTRAFDQLVTPISSLAFSRDGQILALASRWKKDALRLVHLPSCTVYRNWPTSNTPLGRVTSVAFSPGSDMLAAGNEQGKIRLWEIRG